MKLEDIMEYFDNMDQGQFEAFYEALKARGYYLTSVSPTTIAQGVTDALMLVIKGLEKVVAQVVIREMNK